MNRSNVFPIKVWSIKTSHMCFSTLLPILPMNEEGSEAEEGVRSTRLKEGYMKVCLPNRNTTWASHGSLWQATDILESFVTAINLS